MRTVLLVRHGQSHWNVERRIQGQDGTGLTDRGHAQVAATAAFVAEELPGARVVTSDLQRCLETVAPLAQATGTDPVHDPGLRERHFGRWQGLLVDEVAEAEPDVFARWGRGEDVVPEVGGESSEQLAERVVATVRRHLAEVPDGGALVCVTHGGPVHHGTARLLAVPSRTFGGVANAGLTRFGVNGERVWLDAWNSVGHLPLALRTTTGAVQGRRPPPVGR